MYKLKDNVELNDLKKMGFDVYTMPVYCRETKKTKDYLIYAFFKNIKIDAKYHIGIRRRNWGIYFDGIECNYDFEKIKKRHILKLIKAGIVDL